MPENSTSNPRSARSQKRAKNRATKKAAKSIDTTSTRSETSLNTTATDDSASKMTSASSDTGSSVFDSHDSLAHASLNHLPDSVNADSSHNLIDSPLESPHTNREPRVEPTTLPLTGKQSPTISTKNIADDVPHPVYDKSPPSLPLNLTFSPTVLMDPKLYEPVSTNGTPRLSNLKDVVVPEEDQEEREPELQLDQALSNLQSALTSALEFKKKDGPIMGHWDPDLGRVSISSPHGVLLARMGQVGPGNSRILWPEEAAFLVSRGDLQLGSGDQHSRSFWHHTLLMERPVLGVSAHDLAMAYTELKEAGYIIARAKSGFVYTSPHHSLDLSLSHRVTKIVQALVHRVSVVDLVRQLLSLYFVVWFKIIMAVIPHRISLLVTKTLAPNHPTWHLDVWKPVAKFKTTDPGPPDFIVTVVTSASHVKMSALVADGSCIPPPPQQLVAMVEQGSVHFYRVSELGNEVM